MAKLIYTTISSLDGYVADAEGNFDWSVPDEEVHRFVNDLERPIGTYLLGRRMYEVMRYWDSASTDNDEPSAGQEYAKIWQEPEPGVCRQDKDRAGVPTRSDQASEGDRDARRLGGRSDARCAGTEARSGRRVPSASLPRRCGRRQSSPARQRPPRARAAGRAPIR